MLIIVLAGFSGELFESTKKTILSEMPNVCFPGSAIKTSKPFTFHETYVLELAEEVRNNIKDKLDGDRGIHLCLIYFPHQGHEILLRTFTPASLNYRAPRQLLNMPRTKALPDIMKRIRHFQRLSKVLDDLYTNQIRRIPWLLPYENYHIPSFKEFLKKASGNGDTFPSFPALDPLQKDVSLNPKVYVYSDNRGVLFVPAKRRSFHGYEMNWADNCLWLRGVFRLGRSVPVGFHYDARHRRGRLDELKFFDCVRGPVTPQKGADYVNLTPNDRVRLGSA